MELKFLQADLEFRSEVREFIDAHWPVEARSPSKCGFAAEVAGAEIGQRIGELAVEVFGYYALPFPDPLLIDNEGPIGPDFALSALPGMLFSRSWSIDGGTSKVQKNIIAKSVLGL